MLGMNEKTAAESYVKMAVMDCFIEMTDEERNEFVRNNIVKPLAETDKFKENLDKHIKGSDWKFKNVLKSYENKDKIIDITGIELTPGNNGKYCLGNGEHCDENGDFIECCCNECEFLHLCMKLDGDL